MIIREADADADEAMTDEVTALASLLARPLHLPVPRGADDDEGEPTLSEGMRQDPAPAVLPRQRDEFTCPRCCLVVHVSRRSGTVCRDCG